VAAVPDIDAADGVLVRIVDAAVAEAARRSGSWLVCRKGCTQCCIGPFPITQLDARRLRRGLQELAARDPERAARVRVRAQESAERLAREFPGDAANGVLGETEEDEARFDEFADGEPCPALDPESGGCDLYDARPITCRTFGPPMRCGAEAIGVCELCYSGATPEEIASCEVDADRESLEEELLARLGESGAGGRTIVAFALTR
jgi:Fe-S-cluster containining protein